MRLLENRIYNLFPFGPAFRTFLHILIFDPLQRQIPNITVPAYCFVPISRNEIKPYRSIVETTVASL